MRFSTTSLVLYVGLLSGTALAAPKAESNEILVLEGNLVRSVSPLSILGKRQWDVSLEFMLSGAMLQFLDQGQLLRYR
ncbi:hypothetical protein QBC44DRAFT_380397 [Cladorrhinum sp. PSN332]|nr:hypothetical protein QBC44DRAFT_380397 [Cladorrhinum sp. PSN332]